MFIFNLRLAFKAIKRNVFRSFLTIVQIALGMAIIVASINLHRQTLATVKEKYSNKEAIMGICTKLDRVNESKGNDDSGTEFRQDIFDGISKEGYEKLKASKSFSYCSVWKQDYIVPFKAQGQNYSLNALSFADVDFPYILDLELLAGDFFTETDIENAKSNILIETGIAKRVFGSNENAIGQSIAIGKEQMLSADPWEETYIVTGVFSNPRDRSSNSILSVFAIIPWTVTFRLDYFTNYAQPFIFTLPLDKTSGEAQELLGSILNIRSDSFYLSLYSLSYKHHLEQVNYSTFSLSIFGFLSLLVSAISILSINTVNIMERSKEIGLRRALGVSKLGIIGQILLESSIYSFFGGVVGLAAGYFIQSIFHVGSKVPYAVHYAAQTQLTWVTILLSLGIALLVGIVFGFYPAWQAVQVSPAEVLKDE